MATADHDAAKRDSPPAQPRRAWSLPDYQALLLDWFAGSPVSDIAVRVGRSEKAVEGALARLRASGVDVPRRDKTGAWLEGPPESAPTLVRHPTASTSTDGVDPRTAWLLADYQALVDARFRGAWNDEIAASMGRTTAAVAVRVSALRRAGVAVPRAGQRGLDPAPQLTTADLSRIRRARHQIRNGDAGRPAVWAAAAGPQPRTRRGHSNRARRWDRWLDGETHVLRRGEDFSDGDTSAIENAARSAASRRRLSVTVIILNEDTVKVRARRGDGSAAGRKPNAWTEAELRLLLDRAHELTPPGEIAAEMPNRSKAAVEAALFRLRRAGIDVPGSKQAAPQGVRRSRCPVSTADLRRAGFQL